MMIIIGLLTGLLAIIGALLVAAQKNHFPIPDGYWTTVYTADSVEREYIPYPVEADASRPGLGETLQRFRLWVVGCWALGRERVRLLSFWR